MNPLDLIKSDLPNSGFAQETDSGVIPTFAKAGGWQSVPGGKHGGQRKKVGGKWTYKYPSAAHAKQAAAHHAKQAAEHDDLAARARFVMQGDKAMDHQATADEHQDAAAAAAALATQKGS